MKNIAIVCNNIGSGGAVGNVAWQQARTLSNHCKVFVISNTFSDKQNVDNVERLSIQTTTFNYLRRFAHVPNELSFLRQAYQELLSLVQKENIDTIICHGHASIVYVAKPLQKHAKLKTIMVTHGDIFDRPVGTYDYFLTQFYKFVTPKAYKFADTTVVLSPHMADMAIKNGAAKNSIKLIPNGISENEIGLPAKVIHTKNQDTKLLKLLFVGRLAIEKDVATLIKACSLILEKQLPFQLKIIGSGPLKNQLQLMIEEYNLTDKISFLNNIPRQELAEYYLWSDVVCVPSKSDPLPTVVLESMLCSRPVIGTNIGGIRFMVEEQKTGLLFTPGSSQELSEHLVYASQNKAKLIMMGKEAYKSVTRNFSWESNANKLYEIID